MEDNSVNNPPLSVVTTNSRRLTPLVLWLFFNNPHVLSPESRDILSKKQQEEMNTPSKIRKGSFYPERMRICCFDMLCKFLQTSKEPIILEGPNRITFDIVSESLENLADALKEQTYIKYRMGISFLYRIHGSGWMNSEIFQKKHLNEEDQKFKPSSLPLAQAARKRKVFNQIQRSYAASCVDAAHGPTGFPNSDRFTQTYFTSHGTTPPRPSFLDFIAKCASIKLQEQIQKNPLLKSSYEHIEQSMDETALVAIGMMAQECMVASLLPFARAHVAKCRRLDVELQDSKIQAPNAIYDDSASYDLNAFSHWTAPCEEAIADLAIEATAKMCDMPSFPSTRPPDVEAQGSSEFLYDIPSLYQILEGSPYTDKQASRLEAAQQEWYSKHMTDVKSDPVFLNTFLNRKSLHTQGVDSAKVADAIHALNQNDFKLAKELNLPVPNVIHSSHNPNDIDMVEI